MSIRTRTIIYTLYTITCDYCGCVAVVDTSCTYGYSIYNRRTAVRSLGWTLQRGDKVMCSNCRCHKKANW